MKKITFLFLAFLPFLALGQTQYNVTFQVDMNQFAGSFTTPEVNGTFNAWCGNCAAMSDANSDGIWDVVIQLAAGSYEFKFSHDNWTGQENLTPGSPCTMTTSGFTNRTLTISGDTTLPAYCWESCNTCSGTTPTSNVTFQVDMSQYTGSYTDVNLNGSFNGWCGTCALMTDANNDMIYELTVNVPNDTIEFLFTLDGWTTAESFNVGDPCTKTTIDGSNTFTNRVFVPSGDTTLPAVCWEACVDCASIGIDENNWAGDLTITPNPSNGLIVVQGELKHSGLIEIQVTDLQGKVVYRSSQNTALLNETLNLDVQSGIYLVNVKTASGVTTEKLVIRK